MRACPQYCLLSAESRARPTAAAPGKSSLSGRSPLELAFLAGRHLSYFLEEHFIRLLVPTIPDLEDLFLAALSIAQHRASSKR